MFKSLTAEDLFKGIFPGIVGALGSIIVQIVLYILFPSGTVDYYDVKTPQGRLISISIENISNSPSDFILSIDADDVTIFGTNGAAGLNIDKQKNREGVLLNAMSLPGNSILNVVLNTNDRVAVGPLVTIIKSPIGYSLVNTDTLPSYSIWRDRIISIFINVIIVFLFVALANAYINAKLRGFKESVADARKQMDELRSDGSSVKSEMKLLGIRATKQKILFSKLLREARTEVEFWRFLFRDLLTRSGSVTKQDSSRLLNVLAKRLGFTSNDKIDDTSVAQILEFLLDEDSNAKIGVLMNHVKAD
jgi:hypothetical protein